MNFVIAGIVVILIMVCTVAGFMLALIKKLEILESTLDVIKFGVKDAISEAHRIIREDIPGIYGILDKLLKIEKDFDSNIAKSTSELVDVCKNHLCAIGDRCRATEQLVVDCAVEVKSLRESTDTLEDQVTVITDYIREQTVESEGVKKLIDACKDPFFDPEPLCDSCKHNDEEGSANTCCYCRERALCNYEPKNAFEQAGDV